MPKSVTRAPFEELVDFVELFFIGLTGVGADTSDATGVGSAITGFGA